MKSIDKSFMSRPQPQKNPLNFLWILSSQQQSQSFFSKQDFEKKRLRNLQQMKQKKENHQSQWLIINQENQNKANIDGWVPVKHSQSMFNQLALRSKSKSINQMIKRIADQYELTMKKETTKENIFIQSIFNFIFKQTFLFLIYFFGFYQKRKEMMNNSEQYLDMIINNLGGPFTDKWFIDLFQWIISFKLQTQKSIKRQLYQVKQYRPQIQNACSCNQNFLKRSFSSSHYILFLPLIEQSEQFCLTQMFEFCQFCTKKLLKQKIVQELIKAGKIKVIKVTQNQLIQINRYLNCLKQNIFISDSGISSYNIDSHLMSRKKNSKHQFPGQLRQKIRQNKEKRNSKNFGIQFLIERLNQQMGQFLKDLVQILFTQQQTQVDQGIFQNMKKQQSQIKKSILNIKSDRFIEIITTMKAKWQKLTSKNNVRRNVYVLYSLTTMTNQTLLFHLPKIFQAKAQIFLLNQDFNMLTDLIEIDKPYQTKFNFDIIGDKMDIFSPIYQTIMNYQNEALAQADFQLFCKILNSNYTGYSHFNKSFIHNYCQQTQFYKILNHAQRCKQFTSNILNCSYLRYPVKKMFQEIYTKYPSQKQQQIITYRYGYINDLQLSHLKENSIIKNRYFMSTSKYKSCIQQFLQFSNVLIKIIIPKLQGRKAAGYLYTDSKYDEAQVLFNINNYFKIIRINTNDRIHQITLLFLDIPFDLSKKAEKDDCLKWFQQQSKIYQQQFLDQKNAKRKGFLKALSDQKINIHQQIQKVVQIFNQQHILQHIQHQNKIVKKMKTQGDYFQFQGQYKLAVTYYGLKEKGTWSLNEKFLLYSKILKLKQYQSSAPITKNLIKIVQSLNQHIVQIPKLIKINVSYFYNQIRELVSQAKSTQCRMFRLKFRVNQNEVLNILDDLFKPRNIFSQGTKMTGSEFQQKFTEFKQKTVRNQQCQNLKARTNNFFKTFLFQRFQCPLYLDDMSEKILQQLLKYELDANFLDDQLKQKLEFCQAFIQFYIVYYLSEQQTTKMKKQKKNTSRIYMFNKFLSFVGNILIHLEDQYGKESFQTIKIREYMATLLFKSNDYSKSQQLQRITEKLKGYFYEAESSEVVLTKNNIEVLKLESNFNKTRNFKEQIQSLQKCCLKIIQKNGQDFPNESNVHDYQNQSLLSKKKKVMTYILYNIRINISIYYLKLIPKQISVDQSSLLKSSSDWLLKSFSIFKQQDEQKVTLIQFFQYYKLGLSTANLNQLIIKANKTQQKYFTIFVLAHKRFFDIGNSFVNWIDFSQIENKLSDYLNQSRGQIKFPTINIIKSIELVN